MTKNTIPIINWSEQEISYEDLTAMAYDAATPAHLADHYHQVLMNAKNCPFITDGEDNWHRYIFLMDPNTSLVKIWFD